jgi:hypothetical protein
MEVLNEGQSILGNSIFGKFPIILLKVSFQLWKVLNKKSYNVMKTLTHLVLTSFMRSKEKRNDLLCQGHAYGRCYFAPKAIHRCMSLVSLLEMEVQLLKNVENAVIHLYIMLSVLRLISWQAGLWPQLLPWSQGLHNHSIHGVIVYMGPNMRNFIYK